MLAAVFGLLVASCANSPPSATSASPSAAGRGSPAVSTTAKANLRAGLLVESGSNQGQFTLRLVAIDGRILASATAAGRPLQHACVQAGLAAPDFPLSASADRAYYLDGSSQLRYLGTDGNSGVSVDLAPGGAAVLGFAVSPDDSQVAYSLLDAPGGPSVYRLRLLVRPIGTGAPAEIYSTTFGLQGQPVWPVFWSNGKLILAVGSGVCTQNGVWVRGYHVVDTVTAARLATVAGDCSVMDGSSGVPPTRVGPVCLAGSSLTAYRWDGSVAAQFPFAETAFFQLRSSSLAPDGKRLIVCCPVNGAGGAPPPYKGPLLLDSSGGIRPLPEAGDWSGWLDADHVLLAAFTGNDVILTLSTGHRTTVIGKGGLYAVLPAAE